jgi:hypothetical protein
MLSRNGHGCAERLKPPAAATKAESPANCAGLHLRERLPGLLDVLICRIQSAQADFAPFQRRIHSLLEAGTRRTFRGAARRSSEIARDQSAERRAAASLIR